MQSKIILTEYEEQKVVVRYLETRGLKFSSIPNSTFTKSWSQKAKNKASGLRAGLPDLLIIVKNTLLFIELKRVKNSAVSEKQKEWIAHLNAVGGNVVAKVCYGADEAIQTINYYLKYESGPSKEKNEV